MRLNAAILLLAIASTPVFAAVGAFETGMPPLRFGREMGPGFQRAPWELY
jgi:hypothetical protein